MNFLSLPSVILLDCTCNEYFPSQIHHKLKLIPDWNENKRMLTYSLLRRIYLSQKRFVEAAQLAYYIIVILEKILIFFFSSREIMIFLFDTLASDESGSLLKYPEYLRMAHTVYNRNRGAGMLGEQGRHSEFP